MRERAQRPPNGLARRSNPMEADDRMVRNSNTKRPRLAAAAIWLRFDACPACVIGRNEHRGCASFVGRCTRLDLWRLEPLQPLERGPLVGIASAITPGLRQRREDTFRMRRPLGARSVRER